MKNGANDECKHNNYVKKKSQTYSLKIQSILSPPLCGQGGIFPDTEKNSNSNFYNFHKKTGTIQDFLQKLPQK